MKISYQKIADILSRITGISTPIAGIQWEPPVREIEVARNLIIFLENKRALYEDFIHEDSHYVEKSVIEIRQQLTEYLQELSGSQRPLFIKEINSRSLPSKSRLVNNMREMRSSFIEFEHSISLTEKSHIRIWGSDKEFWNNESKEYFKALGRLRETIGYHLALIAIEYGIDVEEKLAVIFPDKLSKDFYMKLSDNRAKGDVY